MSGAATFEPDTRKSAKLLQDGSQRPFSLADDIGIGHGLRIARARPVPTSTAGPRPSAPRPCVATVFRAQEEHLRHPRSGALKIHSLERDYNPTPEALQFVVGSPRLRRSRPYPDCWPTPRLSGRFS